MAFQGFTVCFEGITNNKKKEYSDLIKANGGIVQYMLNEKVTHLVVSEKELSNPNNFNVIKAKSKKIKIVVPSWVEATAKKGSASTKPGLGSSAGSSDGTLVFKELSSLPTATTQYTSSFASLASANPSQAPTITLLIPNNGSNIGNYQVAIFGINFVPGNGFRIKFGSAEAVNYEFHSTTSIVATIPHLNGVYPGDTLVAASNDGGRTYGFPVSFRFYEGGMPVAADTDNVKLALMVGQLQNLRRAITNIDQMERDLRSQMKNFTGITPQLVKDKVSGDGENQDEKVRRKQFDHFEREIKLFISSPFRDMQQERDGLVKMVFPKLRKICTERDVLFTYVDLRWGVTGTQSESAATLVMCLNEIESSDILIGMYGERYGWHISDERDTGSNELLTRTFDQAKKSFGWVEEFKDRSVTEVEMRMFLDRRYDGEDKSGWFYMRDSYYVEEVNEKDRHLYRPEGPKSHEKLNSLKLEINQSSHPVRAYNRPEQVIDFVYEDIMEYIDSKYPPDEDLSPEKREAFRHQVFMHFLTKNYLPNENYFMMIDKYISSDSTKPMLIFGDSGIGKSASVANWAKRHIEHNPQDIVFLHYVGCSPSSSNYSTLLWRLMNDVGTAIGFVEQLPSPEDHEHIARLFPKWIQKAMEDENKNNQRIVIILDGLDHLDDRNSALDLVWFPHTFPPKMRVLLTTGPGHVLSVLTKRNCQSIEIKPLAEAERKSLIRLHLSKSSKRLEEKAEFLIAGAKQTASPRFLLTLLDDISVFGEHDDLEKKIQTNLHAQNTSELYQIVLERLNRDYDKDGKGFISNFLSYLWASRRGLYLEKELTQLLREDRFGDEQWQSFFVAAGENLLNDLGGLLTFTNSDVKSAIESHYLKNPKARINAHSRIADHFSTIEGLNERKLEELPYQLEKSEQWSKLEKLLTDLQAFDKLHSETHKFDLFRYWREIERNTKTKVDKAYQAAVSRNQWPAGVIVSDLLLSLGQFLQSMNKFAAAEEMYMKAIGYFEKASQRLGIAKVYCQLGELYNLQVRNAECEETLKKAQSIYAEEKGEDTAEIGPVLNQLGVLYLNQNMFTQAMTTLDRALQICESQFGSDHLFTADVYYSLGCTYLSTRELEKAESNLLRALRIKESKLGDWDPEVSHILNRLGSMYVEQDQFNDAEACFERALLIRTAKLGEENSRVAQTLRHMVSLFELMEKYTEAIESCTKALRITEKTFGSESIQSTGVLLRLSSLYWIQGQKSPSLEQKSKQLALEYAMRAKKIREIVHGAGHSSVHECQEFIDEMVKPKVVAPPPPPPAQARAAPPPLQATKAIPTPPRPLGRGPPPPPPAPGGKLAPPPPPKVTSENKQNTKVNLNDELENFSMSKLKKKGVQKENNAREQACKMMAQNKRKINFKKLW